MGAVDPYDIVCMVDPKEVWFKRAAERVTDLRFEGVLDPRYTLVPNYERMTASGHLLVFRLHPDDPKLPTFLGRWDHKDDRLDIDIENVPKPEWPPSFQGHHATRVEASTRSFRIDLVYAARPIMRGVVTFPFYLGKRAVSLGVFSFRPAEPPRTEGSD